MAHIHYEKSPLGQNSTWIYIGGMAVYTIFTLSVHRETFLMNDFALSTQPG